MAAKKAQNLLSSPTEAPQVVQSPNLSNIEEKPNNKQANTSNNSNEIDDPDNMFLRDLEQGSDIEPSDNY